ncbi:hypothetical protein SAY86_022911 [Trapa natans]|uniref:Uncharacterized protein n=1 Tax=Trapa natans TaxID=22666 RepID=A0AAN7LTP9_TRANT|nr:hypothetical protein SAY86_022911 [Trapa natans]
MEKSRSFPAYGFELQGHRPNSYSFNGPKSGGFVASNDPENKRKRRVAAYNIFTMEGKIKSRVCSSFKWIKSKFTGDPPYDVSRKPKKVDISL